MEHSRDVAEKQWPYFIGNRSSSPKAAGCLASEACGWEKLLMTQSRDRGPAGGRAASRLCGPATQARLSGTLRGENTSWTHTFFFF